MWIGWLGQEIPEEDQPLVREKLLREYNAVPVFLSDELVHKYYNGAREVGMPSELARLWGGC